MAEQAGSGVQLRIREGVRWAVERYAEREARSASMSWRTAADAADPASAGLLSNGGGAPKCSAKLSHTETAVGTWSAPLIQETAHPLRSPRRWLAGLRSPWRAGYVAGTGGWPLSLLYVQAKTSSCSCRPESFAGSVGARSSWHA